MSVELIDICKAYNGRGVLRDVSITFEEGGSTCIMGGSGQGKTTLLHIIMGLVKPDSGLVRGVGMVGMRIAPVFQEDRLCENLSVGANVRMAARERVTGRAVEEMLERLVLPGTLHQPVRELSGGMRRRVAVARALLSGGELLVFDEPFKGLDDETKRVVMEVVREREKRGTIIWVTHDVDEAKEMGSRVICLPKCSGEENGI